MTELDTMIRRQMQLLGVKFAPLRVPMHRRLQTLAASVWFVVFAFGNIIAGIFVLYALLYTQYLRWLMLLYLAWVYIDRDIGNRGGRRNYWVRRWLWWYYFKEYFPARIEKTVDLNPKRNYMFCAYPHGVLCSGPFSQFSNEYSDFRDLFPGLEPYVHTLKVHFQTPIFRELILSLGGVVASSQAINWVLSAPEGGHISVLLVGGAAESLFCKPGTYHIILNRRKGFVKLALRNGAPMVPVFSFGETDLYDQLHNPEGSMVRRVQEFIRKVTTVAPVVPIGRGLFQYSFGIVPRRRPVTTVVGKPVEVPKIPEPTQEDIDKYHQLYKNALIELFEENKSKYIENAEETHLEIE